MKYMGSKRRIAKYILPIMLASRSEGQCWVEPFVGGANMIDKVDGWRIGADSNRYLIEALLDIRDNLHLLPRDSKMFSEADYLSLRASDDHPHKGYLGFTSSYGGKWLGGWSRSGSRDYVAESYRNAVKQSPLLQGLELFNCPYDELLIPKKSIIYCDPPYAGTTGYRGKFNHPDFWQWCRDKKKEGHTVFISEYNAPDDFTCVWQKEISSSLTANTGGKAGVEKLFTI